MCLSFMIIPELSEAVTSHRPRLSWVESIKVTPGESAVLAGEHITRMDTQLDTQLYAHRNK